MHCKYYLPWTIVYSFGFGQQEINDACVNNDRRTIKRCKFCRHPDTCPEYRED